MSDGIMQPAMGPRFAAMSVPVAPPLVFGVPGGHGTTLSTVEMTAASRWYEVVEMAWPHSSVRAAET